ncbi:MAG: PocR ligand-binding domain-containing protein [Desulfatibacillaceae bacterium]
MGLTDIMPVGEWNELVREFHDRSGLCCSVADVTGAHVSNHQNFCNTLCPRIKESPEALKSICAVAAQNFTVQAQKSGQPVVGECDAGMVKVAVPIFLGGTLLGTAGGCGGLMPDGEIEDFMIAKTTGMGAKEITLLSATVPVISLQQAREFADYAMERISHIMACAVAG